MKLTKNNLLYLLKSLNVGDWVLEYRFDNARRFKADFANLEHKILIEYEGVFSHRSRHTTVTGFTKDCTKYNLAQIKGFRVLRYTAINLNEISNDILKLIEHDREIKKTD